MAQITNWCAKPVGEVQITEERSQWQSREMTVADSDLEVRALGGRPFGPRFWFKNKGADPPVARLYIHY